MSRTVVVTYQLRPESMDEHVKLIEAVFEQLHREQPTDVDYRVMVLEDGVSFVHVSTSDTADGSNPLTRLEAFGRFNEGIGDRVATPPSPSQARLVGSYHPS
jgi:hypothetical protein